MIERLRDTVLVHLGRDLPANAAGLAWRAGGAVLTGAHRAQTAGQLHCLGLPLLFQDDGRAVARARRAQGTLISAEQGWLVDQHGQPAAYTNPVSYVPSRRRGQAAADTALDAAIAQADQFAGVVDVYDPSAAVLRLFALHHDWLARDATLLARRLAGMAGQVGIMLGHNDDPLSSAAAVHGLIEVVTTLPDVALLRTDLGGLGALAWGASFASIGVDTNTQAFVRYRQRGSVDRSPRVLVPALLCFWRADELGQDKALAADPLLVCGCDVCDGAALARFAVEGQQQEAAEHAVACWNDLADQLRALDPAARPALWTANVRHALDCHEELADKYGLPEPIPGYLSAWDWD